MGQNVSQEEGAIVRLLHILSKRGITYDESSLHRLIWCRDNGSPPDTQTVFHTETWEVVRKVLWDAVSNGECEIMNFI